MIGTSGWFKFGENDVEGVLRALQDTREGDIEFDAMIADHAAGDAGFDQPLVRQVGVAPAGEEVQPIPLALSVANKNEDVVGQRVGHVVVRCLRQRS